MALNFGNSNAPRTVPAQLEGHKWKKGQSGNPSGARLPNAVKKVRDAAREHSLEAIAKLVEIMRGPSPRFALVAAQTLLARGIGKETEWSTLYQPKAEQAAAVGEVDVKTLSDSQLERIHAILKEPLA